MSIRFTLNGREVVSTSDPTTPLLWVLREEFGLTGTKYACGMEMCGACMVRLNGEQTPTCVRPVADFEGQDVVTVEHIGAEKLNAVQQAWIEFDVPQCGYCQSGQIIAATALLDRSPNPTDADIDAGMDRNLCRCGTYPRIRAAVKRAAEIARAEG